MSSYIQLIISHKYFALISLASVWYKENTTMGGHIMFVILTF